MRLTKYESSDESMFPYKLKDEELSTELDSVHKLGQLEDLMEKYNIKTLEQVESAFIGFVSDYTEEGRNHIGELLKLEEELGIDLITFMRILHQMDALDFKPVEKIDKDWIATPYQNVRYSIDLKKKRLIEHGREKHVLKFNEYGKKWALTKEELE